MDKKGKDFNELESTINDVERSLDKLEGSLDFLKNNWESFLEGQESEEFLSELNSNLDNLVDNSAFVIQEELKSSLVSLNEMEKELLGRETKIKTNSEIDITE